MPSRKSDAPRRSGVSAARFVLADDTGTTPDADSRQTPEANPRSTPPTDSRLAPMTPDEDIAMTPEPPAVAAAGASATPSAAARTQSEPATTAANTSTTEPHQTNLSFSGNAQRTSVAGTATSPSDKRDKEKDKDRDAVTIEDLTLPKSIITRLAKGVLPPNTQIQANAILALSKSATVFISYLASTANEFTVASNKKTIMPADVFKALEDSEFGFMKERLEAEFAKFNEVQTSKRSTYRKKVAAAKKAVPEGAGVSSTNLGESSMMSMGDDPDEGGHTETDTSFLQRANTTPGGRAAKKAKIDAGSSSMHQDGGNDEISDAETVPDEPEEEEDEDDDVEEEEEDEEETQQEEHDETEDQAGAADEDEALDDADDSE